MLLTAILTAVLTAVLTSLAIVFALSRGFSGVKRKFEQWVQSYFTSRDDNTPSDFAAHCDVVAKLFAQRVAFSLKSTFMGVQSLENKNEKNLQADIIMDLNPTVAAVLESFPALKKRIYRNPGLAGQAMNMLAGIAAKGNHKSADATESKSGGVFPL